jgi:hypothetical protein
MVGSTSPFTPGTASVTVRAKKSLYMPGIHNLCRRSTAKKLILELLIHDHLKRATVTSALKSDWIQTDIQQLKLSYRRRITSNT